MCVCVREQLSTCSSLSFVFDVGRNTRDDVTNNCLFADLCLPRLHNCVSNEFLLLVRDNLRTVINSNRHSCTLTLNNEDDAL